MRTTWAIAAALLLSALNPYRVAGQTPSTDMEVIAPAAAATFHYQPLDDQRLLVTAEDRQGNPLRHLSAEDFDFRLRGRRAEILSVEPLATSQEVSLNIVMVIDNSASMKQRGAVAAVLEALEAITGLLRPIDNVTLVVFDDRQTRRLGDRDLHVRVKSSSDRAELRDFLKEGFSRGLTDKTVLYEGMLAGLTLARQMPPEAHKFLVVFSDGEDLNSAVKVPAVAQAAEGLENFEAYAVDYMPGSATDPFLQAFTADHGGRVWKAESAGDLVPIFQAVSSKMLYRHVVTYRFLFPPTGNLSLAPARLTIEETTTIDSAPLLNYVYFASGESAIDERYVTFARQTDTESFDEQRLHDTLEKYAHVLNIIGQRLRNRPEAAVRLVGCNSHSGVERGRLDLSRARAEAVKAYLQFIWGIAPERLAVEARHLPEFPSSGRSAEGREENQRVEIHSMDPAILDVVRSVYVEARSGAQGLELRPRIEAEHGIARWKLTISGGAEILYARGDSLPLDDLLVLDWQALPLMRLAPHPLLRAELFVEDREGQSLLVEGTPVEVDFIRREQRLARHLGFRVQEKYALILFDFDSSAIKDRNAAIVDQIVGRIQSLPEVAVAIEGHTDDIGPEDYNVDLSRRRALAVYSQIATALAGETPEAVTHAGVGPFDPLYGNGRPENRAMNRTVTVTLEYEQKD
jgi:outer membrane protein OmpA-like peptidoglycan-associated protein/Mg-chelatase subunit ChlD